MRPLRDGACAMIVASLSDSARYESLNPLFQRAFDFVREAGPASLEPGPPSWRKTP